MKNTIIIIIVAIVVAAAAWYFFFRGETAPATNTETTEESVEEANADVDMPSESTATMETGTYEVNNEESSITWQAGKPAIAGYVHTGTFDMDSGEVKLTDSEITGEFVIDVNSLQMTSLGGGKAGQESTLEGHLKGERFFDVETYPTATFRVTNVTPKELPGPGEEDYTATGELTLKGETHEVNFPMKVIVSGEDEVWMSADLTIDRTLWGIDYGSASIAEEITDNIIGDEVKLNLVVKLEK